MAICSSLNQGTDRCVVRLGMMTCGLATAVSTVFHVTAACGLLGKDVQKVESSFYAPLLYIFNILAIALCSFGVGVCVAPDLTGRRVHALAPSSLSLSAAEVEDPQDTTSEYSYSYSDVIEDHTFVSLDPDCYPNLS